MRYRDLCESTGPSGQINDMIQMLLVTMTANGMTEISPELLAAEVQKRFGLTVGTAILIDIAEELPIVQSADEQMIVLGNETEMAAEDGVDETSKDKVADMANGGSSTPGLDTWTTT